MFGIIDLAKTKIVDPTVFVAIFLPRRIWSRAFGRARFFFATNTNAKLLDTSFS